MSTTLTANATTTIMKQQQSESCRITANQVIFWVILEHILLLESSILGVSDEKLIRYIAFESWQLMLKLEKRYVGVWLLLNYQRKSH